MQRENMSHGEPGAGHPHHPHDQAGHAHLGHDADGHHAHELVHEHVHDHSHDHHAAPAAAPSSAVKGGKDVEYTCPMHPQIRQMGPGHCPICGMALEPVIATADTGKAPSCGT